jgi:chorismate synthase
MDSIGGTVTCVVRNVPSGLGEPVFDKFEAKLAQAMMSIPATKAFEVGSGFRGTEVPGSKHNDAFVLKNGKLGTSTNWSGGIQGGITNGEDIYFRFEVPPLKSYLDSPLTLTGSDSSHPQLYPKHKTQRSTTAHQERSLLAVVTTLVLSRAPCPSLRPWRPLSSWTSYSFRTHARPLQGCSLQSQPSHLPW